MRKSLRRSPIVSILLIIICVFGCETQHNVSPLVIPVEIRVNHPSLLKLIPSIEHFQYILPYKLIICIKVDSYRIRWTIIMTCRIYIFKSCLSILILDISICILVNVVKIQILSVNLVTVIGRSIVHNHHKVIWVVLCKYWVKIVLYPEFCIVVVTRYNQTHWQLFSIFIKIPSLVQVLIFLSLNLLLLLISWLVYMIVEWSKIDIPQIFFSIQKLHSLLLESPSSFPRFLVIQNLIYTKYIKQYLLPYLFFIKYLSWLTVPLATGFVPPACLLFYPTFSRSLFMYYYFGLFLLIVWGAFKGVIGFAGCGVFCCWGLLFPPILLILFLTFYICCTLPYVLPLSLFI